MSKTLVRVRLVAAIWLILFLRAHAAMAQTSAPSSVEDASAQTHTYPLWTGNAPGALGDGELDRPTITFYAASDDDKPVPAVIVFPGGSYGYLASNHEGRQMANWFNSVGMAAFVVRYRVGPRYHHPIELRDAQRAIRLVRSRAAEFHVMPDKIGILGFSAGGHLASTAETHFDPGGAKAEDTIDRVSSRPDFAVLAYPVISLIADYAHQPSWQNLLGKDATPEMRRALSNEFNVTADTPLTFLFSSSTDTVVPPENSVAFYLALRKANVPAELHIFQDAPHGVGLDLNDPAVGEWSTLLLNWLRANDFVPR
jgi:acetyl esterase/lipase